jgi:hypothetical protein
MCGGCCGLSPLGSPAASSKCVIPDGCLSTPVSELQVLAHSVPSVRDHAIHYLYLLTAAPVQSLTGLVGVPWDLEFIC